MRTTLGRIALGLATAGAGPLQAQPEDGGATYANPLSVVSAAHGPVESCADPEVVKGQADDPHWYMYCTSDPLTGADRDASGELVFHLIPTFRSADLVTWEYQGDAFDRDPATPPLPPPAWADPATFVWAPEVEVIDGRWHLFVTVTDLAAEAGGEPGCDWEPAIGHAVAAGPLGPWTPAPGPLVAPRRGGEGCDFLTTIDAEVTRAEDGTHHLYYGGFYGGIEVRDLLVAADGSLAAPVGTTMPVAIANRYEGAEVVRYGGFYYLFASATNCCAGPQTGYAAFVGRSERPEGPFLDREGVSLLDAGVGGTPVIAQNGNRWVGPGHNTVLEDEAGQWWTIYHAVDEADPFFAGAPGFTKRPALLDRIDWIDGWPVLNGGGGPSDAPLPAPVAQPGQPPRPEAAPVAAEEPGLLLAAEEFDGTALAAGWTWLREPTADGLIVADGTLRMATQDADLHEASDDASVLLREAPAGDYLVESRVRLDVPAEGCCHNFVQAGLVVHAGDDAYVKLVLASLWETRQTEFARELPAPAEGAPAYGNTVVGPPGEDWTHLRLAVRRTPEGEAYTASTSRDGATWVRGGTWTHALGAGARIGLVAMGGDGFTATFDHVRVHALGR